ncbi:hypothetical protein Tco_1228836 [Tanacetum coccineum]
MGPKPSEKKIPNMDGDNGIKLKNLFEKLHDHDDDIVDESLGNSGGRTDVDDLLDDPLRVPTTKSTYSIDSDSEVEEMLVEANPYTNTKEASTSSKDVSNVYVCAILESHADLSALSKSSQAMHVKIVHKATNKTIFCSFIFAANTPTERRLLWAELGRHKHMVRDSSWILMGDFNVALNLEDTYAGSSSMSSAMCEFKDCVEKIEVMDVNSLGLHYTWNQKPNGGSGVLRKLDSIMANLDFIDVFPGAHAIFQPYRISDHTPAVLKIPSLIVQKPKPFKFFNFLTYKSKIIEVIKLHWKSNVEGNHMFKVVSNLKSLKKPIRKLLHDQGNLHDHVNKLRFEHDKVQKALDTNPTDATIREEESAYSVKSRNSRSRIEAVVDSNGNLVSDSLVPDVFVTHYEQFLGSSMLCNDLNVDDLFVKKVSADSVFHMVRNVTNDEIKAAMFSIGDDRASGLGGFTSAFFKKGWEIVSNDVSTPLRVNDYRPISCCNVIYKCISKILTNRIIEGIKEVVSDNQSAFVLGNKDLSQGDPLSPYLFTLVMEILTLIIQRRVRSSNSLRYHNHCDELGIINVCFADDLFIFIHGELESARVIMDSLEEFKLTLGLVSSIPNSMAYFCNATNHVNLSILSIMPFAEGDLLVKYLGVPLISLRLFNKDCKVLVKKAKNRIGDWKNKSLSFAGRLQLCKSVISSMHVYWASVLMIPKGIIYDIHQLIHGFLWCNGEYKRGKAKVAWDFICLPKHEGGLGLRNLDVFNYALMTTHIWNIVSNKESLWLSRFFSHRDITNEGFHIQTKVADLISNGNWIWPQPWISKALILGQIVVSNIDGSRADVIQWKASNGSLSVFSVAKQLESFKACMKSLYLVLDLEGRFQSYNVANERSLNTVILIGHCFVEDFNT